MPTRTLHRPRGPAIAGARFQFELRLGDAVGQTGLALPLVPIDLWLLLDELLKFLRHVRSKRQPRILACGVVVEIHESIVRNAAPLTVSDWLVRPANDLDSSRELREFLYTT